jgi:hypothetical protein
VRVFFFAFFCDFETQNISFKCYVDYLKCPFFQLAQEYLKVQTEIAYLSRYKTQLAERLSEAEGLSQLDQQDSERHQEELRKLENERVCKITLRPV